MNEEKLAQYQEKFTSGWEQAQAVFPQCVAEAHRLLSAEGVDTYIEKADFLGKIGLGVEPCLVYLAEMPEVASHIGEASLERVADYVYQLGRSPNRKSVMPFLESLGSVCRRVDDMDSLNRYIQVIETFIKSTETVIHGHNSLYESAGLVEMLQSIPQLIGKLSIEGVCNFVKYGVQSYQGAPDQAVEYFSLQSADARAIIQRERHGVVFKDVERHLNMLKESMWDCDDLPFVTFSTSFDQLRKPVPYLDEQLIAVPDMYDSEQGVSGLDRYRAMLAHLMAHKRWTTKLMADNFAPHMQLFISTFEDCRVERLAMARYPGLKKYFLALHPVPPVGDCDESKRACLRYRATRLSRALIDEDFDPEDELIASFRHKFNAILAEKGEASSTEDSKELGTLYYVKSRLKSDSLPDVYFDHTEISYRDDNRYMWFHYEENDEAEDFHQNEYESDDMIADEGGLPPRRYDEWDYLTESYRPDWTTVYERLHPSANAGDIDRLLEKHGDLAKRLKKMIEMLKPQNKKRIRFQEEGEELDLDVAIRSLIDFKHGSAPDPRINYSHITDSRNIAVMLLVDMSESLNEKLHNSNQTLLELSQESLAIMSWTVEQLGDRFAIAGFHSDTRHQVLYHHIKGYSEHYGEEVKSRLAAMEAGLSTRMGAAMRHAAHYLESQVAEKKLMLILTDGEPADIDSKDPRMLIEDTHRAVQELKQKGIYSYCINMDPKADEYVSDIFGNHYTIIDHVEKLPEQLPRVFMELTH